MSKNKDGQVEVNADGSMSGTDNSRRSGPSGNINNNGIRSTNGSGDDYGHNHGKSKSSGNHHNRGNTAWQSNLTLGPFTEAASEAIQHMSETHKAIRTLSDLYTKHVRDIEEISKIQERCNELETQCGKKDELIKRQKGTIITLKELSRDMEEEFEQNRAEIGKEREDLEAEKKKFDKQKETVEKRAKAQEAEQKSKQDKELEKLKAEQDKHYKILKEKLEQDVKKQEDEIRKRLTDLETDNRTLSEELNAQKEKVEEQQVKLAIAKDDYDDLKRLKNSFKDEKEKLKEQLDMIESEFALNGQTTEFYKKKFHDASSSIEDISLRYFSELNRNDFDTIREELIKADPCFASVPISDSEESQKLRIAHAQRVISSSLHKNIWQPFSSEKTLSHPDFVSLLIEIAADLGKPSRDGSTSRRAASVWTALTMRALESLSRTSPLSPTLTSLGSSPRPSPSGRAPIPRRANKVVDDVLCVLSPLVALSQEEQLRTELLALADSAISVWHSVQTDELKIIVCACLDRANRSEWRYHKFDPLPSSSSDKDTDAEIVSSTHPRIFALFPRVIAAQKLSRATELAAGPPGSWPQSQDEPRTIETCIHTGTGLPEWSPLVIKGKYEEEERKNYIREEMERVMQEANARSRRNGGQSRRDSMVASGSGSGPPSPTTQFRGENGMMGKVEE